MDYPTGCTSQPTAQHWPGAGGWHTGIGIDIDHVRSIHTHGVETHGAQFFRIHCCKDVGTPRRIGIPITHEHIIPELIVLVVARVIVRRFGVQVQCILNNANGGIVIRDPKVAIGTPFASPGVPHQECPRPRWGCDEIVSRETVIPTHNGHGMIGIHSAIIECAGVGIPSGTAKCGIDGRFHSSIGVDGLFDGVIVRRRSANWEPPNLLNVLANNGGGNTGANVGTAVGAPTDVAHWIRVIRGAHRAIPTRQIGRCHPAMTALATGSQTERIEVVF